jgi:protein-S-isoprenylcysteine O-methyltransferase Ste14
MTARMQLGSSFSLKAEAHRLITHGLYSKIRNPIYLFAFVAFLSVLAAMRAWLGMAIFVAIYSAQLIRVKREEKVLEAAFGEEYKTYRKHTWF